jgi:hypothetical protein
MGIRFSCPNGHKLNVKAHLAGKRGVCPECGTRFDIPVPGESQSEVLGAGRSENVLPAAGQSSSIAAAPSIIIAVTDVEALGASEGHKAAHLPAPGPNPPALQQGVAEIVPPSSVIAAPPVETSAESYRPTPASSRGLQVAISIILFVLVIVLGIVLFLVMSRDTQSAPKKQASVGENSSTHQVSRATNRRHTIT